jgi:hypothetical protein
MIPTDPNTLDKMKELAERNMAKGDWGDEVTIPGLPEGTIPMSPGERNIKTTVSQIFSKNKHPKRRVE